MSFNLFQSLGNHEFDNGVSGLTPFIENLTSPVLCANLVLTKVPELAREENLKKSIVINIDGNKVGIVGYLTPETKVVAKPNDVQYIEEVKALTMEVKNLQDQGIKIIIALGHSGFLKDQEIGREVDGIDLVIGGHTNTFLFNGTTPDVEYAQGPYPTYVTQASGRRVPVVQAYAYTKYLGKLVLTFNSDGEVINADGLPILLDKSIPQDPDVLELLNKYRNDKTLSSTEDILGSTSLVLSSTNCALEECNLGNLITDAMVFRYASDYKGIKNHWTDAPIAILQAGGIRTSIAHEIMPTNITKGDLLAVMPFEGNMTAVFMNGTVLLQALEVSAADYASDIGARFLQFSGLRVVYNMTKPKGSRVVKAQARCWTCSVPLFINVHENSIYKVLMPSFLSNGGDGYSMFKGLEYEPLDYSELTSTEYYVTHYTPVFAQVESRITIINEDVQSSSAIIHIMSAPVLFPLMILISMFL